MKHYAAGIDIGGTRTKIGIVERQTGTVSSMSVIDSGKDEAEFLTLVNRTLEERLKEKGLNKKDLEGAGISIGSYVFPDGSIDGMSCFLPYMKEGYPLGRKLEKVLEMPVRADNDVRLIGLAESLYGAGRGYDRVLTITLGSGVGVSMCTGGSPMDHGAFCHLAGHVKVRAGSRIPALDASPCYCGITGCLESTCSGLSLEKYIRSVFGEGITNREFFDRARKGEERAFRILEWYLDCLSEGLNQYIYFYCPDVIVLGGGLSHGLKPLRDDIQKRVKAKVHFRQHTEIAFSSLMEAGGVIGAAALFDGGAVSGCRAPD